MALIKTKKAPIAKLHTGKRKFTIGSGQKTNHNKVGGNVMGTRFEDIRNALWKGADTFRGTIDAANYKDFVLSMLFIKYLDDTYEELVDRKSTRLNSSHVRISYA